MPGHARAVEIRCGKGFVMANCRPTLDSQEQRTVSMVQCVDDSFRHLSNVEMGKETDAFGLLSDLFQLLKYIKGIKNKHIKKAYDDNHLSRVCFDKKMYFKKQPFLDYCKVQLIVGVKYFEVLVLEIEAKIKDKSPDFAVSVITIYKDQLYDYIFDFKLPVETLEKKLDPNYIFFSGGKSSATRSADIYRFSKALAYGGTYDENLLRAYHKESQVAAVFVLRQALELKFERILGVVLFDKNGARPKLRHGVHLDFILKNTNLFEFPEFDFTLLSDVYNWCSGVVHQGFQPLIWQVPYAHELCNGLFAWGDLDRHGGMSCDGGVRILNVDEIRQKFLSHIFSIEKKGYWGIYFDKPEASDFSAPEYE